jgi:multisubunit Na+/H+ antiporter MnhB subunit
MKPAKAAAVMLAAAGAATALIMAMLDLPPAPVRLPEQVMANMPVSGVAHPVTAVLLNFRGYDTLLEVGVLLLALLGALAVAPDRPARPPVRAPEPVLHATVQFAVPLMAVFALYLLWAGSHRPGGAFQAAAVLASAAVLLDLAGLLAPASRPGRWLRLGLAGGLLLFLAVAGWLLAEGSLLGFPPASAGALILLIEAGLTVSLGLVLAGFYLFFSGHEPC